MTDSKSMSIVRAVVVIVVVLLLAAVIGIIWKYTNGGNENFKTFTVRYGDKQILSTDTDTELEFESGVSHYIEVDYTFDIGKSEPRDYIVKVLPNKKLEDVKFTTGGKQYLYSDAKELTSAFTINKGATSFMITFPKNLTLKNVLEKIYGKSVSVTEPEGHPYTLVISSYNEKVTYRINFSIKDKAASNGSTGSGQTNGGNTNTPSTPTTPTDYEYTVQYLFSGDATNLSNLSLTGDEKAKAGATVNFKITIGDSHYSISSMRISGLSSVSENEAVKIKDNGSLSYSFTMPKGNITVWVYFTYTPDEPSKTLYSIEYDSLGWASMMIVDLKCPDKAAAGEKVTFTATIKPEYASEYKISHILVQLGSGMGYDDLDPTSGTYTFTMPDEPTMENGYNEGYITLMFYIIPIDM